MREEIRQDLAFMTYAPILFISAKTGQRVDRLFELIDYVSNQALYPDYHRHAQQCPGGRPDPGAAAHRQGPPAENLLYDPGGRSGRRILWSSATTRRLFHFSYQRYLENCIRNTFGLEGTPIILSIRQKGDKEE